MVIEALSPLVIGRDPRRVEHIVSALHVIHRQSEGSIMQQAIGAIENVLLDVKAKDLGVPVYALFGGPVRDRIPVYCPSCSATTTWQSSARKSGRVASRG